MKKVSKLLHLVLGFTTGLLAGAFIRLGFEIVNGRPVSIGGEALLLPLVILLICFGFSLGKEVRVQRNFSKAYERGYRTVSYTHLDVYKRQPLPLTGWRRPASAAPVSCSQSPA